MVLISQYEISMNRIYLTNSLLNITRKGSAVRKKYQLTVTSRSSNFSFSCGLDRITLEKVYAIQDLMVAHGAHKPSMSLISREALQSLHRVLSMASRENDRAIIAKHLESMKLLRRTGMEKSIAPVLPTTLKESA